MYAPYSKPVVFPLPTEAPGYSAEAQLLIDAAEYIRVHGHKKRGAGGFGEAACVRGAIGSVAFSQGCGEIEAAAFELLRYSLASTLGCSPTRCYPVDWNDAPERTADDVIAALFSAANSGRAG